MTPEMPVEYVDSGWGAFPILRAAEIDAELRKLATLAREDLRDTYIGDTFDDRNHWFREVGEYDEANWLQHIYDAWIEIRLSLASAMAYDTWYGGLPDFMTYLRRSLSGREPTDEEAMLRLAARGCAYYLDNAVYRFYSFYERFLQFCNSYLRLDVPEGKVDGPRIQRELQRRGEGCVFYAELLGQLREAPFFRDVVEARKGITHRRHPKMAYTDDWLPDYAPGYLPAACGSFHEITVLLDQVLERLAGDDEEYKASHREGS